ncbi:vacuolar amino acid transporter 5 [Cryptococcus wingfieldii CBS 7118]|uniref:Vacuolar amino acid transporter 5 n=1 Tax=Cryptococcus wingfieldii CBS 7118 TaxID=1295528 RepID=A0A1E3JMQ2_9TREE|nr:vacuolar amino acid transporter 5 [Cryptococcus wingfieldii CBS 7118]ODO01936.1 vacuolar amino acid transporter 5 [Cryptococcus wingfieldii CBS 7118]
MPADYGAASPPRASSASSTIAPVDPPKDGHASVTSSVTNLSNTILGAGALAFPSALAAMGIVPGMLSCLSSGMSAMFGLYLLSRCATVVGTRPGDEGRKASFNEIARLTFGKGWATKVFDLAIASKCFGVSVSYLIICKTLLPQVCQTVAQIVHHPLAEDSILLASHFWLFVWLVIITPLSFMRTLDSLRFTSQIALLTVVYLVLVVVGWFIFKGPSPQRGEVVFFKLSSNSLSSFPVQIFAYTCSQNLFPIYNELKDKTQKRMNTVIGTSIGSAIVVYQIIGLFGYLTFGSIVSGNVISMYPATTLLVAVGRLGIVLLVGLSYPLQVLPCRSSLRHLTHSFFKHHEAAGGVDESSFSRRVRDEEESEEGEEGEEDALVPKGHGQVKHEMPPAQFIALTLGILFFGFLIAYNVHELEVVLAFVGSTGSTIISFILPGFFYFRLFRDEPGSTKWWALFLGIYGIGVMVFCLTFNVLNLVRG